jgi:hypothetical protein
MRRRGFKLVQMWMPDPHAPGFAEECRRQSRLVARQSSERTTMKELEALQEGTLAGWEWKE